MIEIKNLSYNFEKNQVLKNINIKVNENEFVSVVGASGVGKTTLFNLIAGILELKDGEILIDSDKNYMNKVAYMLQKDLLFEHKTVVENIILPLIINKISKKKATDQAKEILKLFNLYEYSDKYPKELSGGMRQRIALMRTCMFKRNIFLLDEAFSALDAITKRELHRWYVDLAKKFSLTTILITHDIDEAVLLSNKVYILGNKPGEILKEIKINFNSQEDIEYQKLKYKREILEIMNL